MMNNLLDAIEKERWTGKAIPDSFDIAVRWHNAGLNAIAKAAKQPRVMKRWTEDCKPNEEPVLICITARDGSSLILEEPVWMNCQIIDSGTIDGYKITHWLEIEPTPILP